MTFPVIVSVILALPLPIDWIFQRLWILEITNTQLFLQVFFLVFHWPLWGSYLHCDVGAGMVVKHALNCVSFLNDVDI